MKTKHSVAPWTESGGEIRDHHGNIIAEIYAVKADNNRRGRPTADSNARLIAAAPTLLEALRQLVRYNESDPDLYDGDDDGVLGRLIYAANEALDEATP